MNNKLFHQSELDNRDGLSSCITIAKDKGKDYDILTQIAAQIFDSKLSLLTMHLKQEFIVVSQYSNNINSIKSSTPYCEYLLQENMEMLLIEDVFNDERFQKSFLSSNKPDATFYIGLPLRSEKLGLVGTICVVDNSAKKVTESQIKTFQSVALQVVKLVELHNDAIAIKENNDELIKIAALFNESQRINKTGAWELNLLTGLAFWTDEVYHMHEVPIDEVFEKSKAIDFYHPDDRQIIIDAIDKTVETSEPFDVEARLITAKNNQIWVRSSGKIWKEGNQKVKLIGTFQDITKAKNAEQEILKLLEIAESQNKRLKNFAYIVSHNLRSHAGGISTLINLINYEYPELSKTEFFDYLTKSSVNLTETINHLNDVVQINLLDQETLDNVLLQPIIQNNINSLITEIKDNNITIINEVPPTSAVQAIPAYLDSIVMNLISNAIKYSSKERNSYLKIQSQNIGDFTELKFIDNGLGIDLPNNGNKLFGMYKTFHNNSDSRGIGLFITKNQVESMKGKIEVESEVNIGSTFKIYLKNEKI